MRGLAAGFVLLMSLALGLAGEAVQAQPVAFGAADDPREQLQRVWWRRENSFYAMGGLSLIAAQWRGAGSLSLDLVTRSLSGKLSGTLRAGVLGEYEPDIDEPYDLLRLIEFIRYEPPQNVPLHLRIGTLDRIRLGTGHVVNFFSSAVAWDERTVGAEFMWGGRLLELAAFTDNLLADGVVGGRAAVRPLAFTDNRVTQTLQLGASYVTDLAERPPGAARFEAYNTDVFFALFQSGDVFFSPFASYAWYRDFGDGVALGADLHSREFLDLLNFRFRLALFYNDIKFVPGYIGSFYTVDNLHARILESDAGGDPTVLAGQPLDKARGANDLMTELHLLVGRRFEFWYSFRRHYGQQRRSELHLRLFLRAPEQLRLELGIDRGGLTSFFSIFESMDDQSALVFGTDYRIFGPLWLFLRARYSYERIDAGDDFNQRYLVQRRFEPLTGLRFSF